MCPLQWVGFTRQGYLGVSVYYYSLPVIGICGNADPSSICVFLKSPYHLSRTFKNMNGDSKTAMHKASFLLQECPGSYIGVVSIILGLPITCSMAF